MPSKKKIQSIPKREMARIGAALKKANKETADRERRQKESVTLVVGKHKGCGGKIEYQSFFVTDELRSKIFWGGKRPTREATTCSCTKCGQAFDPSFKTYRDQIEKYRNGK